MGRPRKPTALKIANGNPGKRALPKNEPIPKGFAVIPPELKAREIEIWNRLFGQLKGCGLATRVDSSGLATLARVETLHEAAYAKVKKEGMVGRTGKTSPHFGAFRDLTGHLIRLYSEFGMTPASRSKVTTGLADSKKKGSIEEFLDEK